MYTLKGNSMTWSKRCGGFLVLTCVVGILSSSPAAGQASNASIVGQLTDQSGGVLPGVTVTATSPALQIAQVTAVTNETGEYRLAPLPIGVYEVTFELTGFQTTRNPNIRLTVGFQARVNAVMNVASLEQQVNVTGAAPVVDLASTSSTTVLSKEMLELTPTSRQGWISLMAMAPGVRANLDVGGNSLVATPNVRVFAQPGEAWLTLEGVSMGTFGLSGVQIDYGVVEEARVQSLGTDADSPTRGVQMAAIVKSGGNDFHGSANWAQSNKGFQANNIDAELRAIGITQGDALENRWDVSGELGGRLIRDKLWFYGSYRRRREEQTRLGAFKPDGSIAVIKFGQGLDTEKLSYQASQGFRLIGFHQRQLKLEDEAGDEFRDYLSREDTHSINNTYKIEGQSILSNTLVASLQFGAWVYDVLKLFNTGDTLVGREDLETERHTGEPYSAGEYIDTHRLHTAGHLTWYRPNWFHGNHEIKAGFDHTVNYYGRGFDAKKINYRLFYLDGVPEEIAIYNTPAKPVNQEIYLGAYVTDSWTIGRRMTLNVGARFAHDNAFAPAQCSQTAIPPGNVAFPGVCFERGQLRIWNSLAPRVRMSYDVSGDGRTAIKGGWGRYDRMRAIAGDAGRVNRVSIANAHYRWRDLNRNNDYDPGEVNLNTNGPDFLRTTGLDLGAITPNGVANPDEWQPKIDEFSLSVERQVMRDFAVRITGIHSTHRNNTRIQNNLRPYEAYSIPVTNRDPGPDNRPGTADDGGMVTYYEFPRTLAGAAFEELMAVNAGDDQTFKSFELAGTKRLSNGWQFMGSYSATKKHQPPLGALNPNTEINTTNDTWEWDGKLMGAYVFPFNILVSSQLEHRSGVEFARQVLFRNLVAGATIPSLAVNVEPLSSNRRPNINLVSIRAEKSFQLSASQRLAVRLNVYNALNANTTTALTVRAGATYLRPTAILPPRIAEFSVSYTF